MSNNCNVIYTKTPATAWNSTAGSRDVDMEPKPKKLERVELGVILSFIPNVDKKKRMPLKTINLKDLFEKHQANRLFFSDKHLDCWSEFEIEEFEMCYNELTAGEQETSMYYSLSDRSIEKSLLNMYYVVAVSDSHIYTYKVKEFVESHDVADSIKSDILDNNSY